jgi:hypothetical protein
VGRDCISDKSGVAWLGSGTSVGNLGLWIGSRFGALVFDREVHSDSNRADTLEFGVFVLDLFLFSLIILTLVVYMLHEVLTCAFLLFNKRDTLPSCNNRMQAYIHWVSALLLL